MKVLILLIPLALVGAFLIQRNEAPQVIPNISNIAKTANDTELGISLKPEQIWQGNAVLVTLEGLTSTTSAGVLSFNGEKLDLFMYDGNPSALMGIDLKMPPGSYKLELNTREGGKIKKDLIVRTRDTYQAPLGIPEKLGGNTPASEARLISNLTKENAVLASVKTEKEKLWNGEFTLPVANPFITDPYGYTRLTGASTISHKGTDFRAPDGTDVYAMNAGVVRLARNFTIYGKTIVIDHGLGVHTLYMHLSRLLVKEGEMVETGMLIAESGRTGYAESSHLHISIKIGGVSIDPMEFVELFKNRINSSETTD